MSKLLRAYMSNSYALDDFRLDMPAGHQFTQDEVIQYALGEAMERYGRHLQREAARHNAIPIDGVRVEIRKTDPYDIQVRLYLEEGEAGAVS